jgi:hypothetical protein
VTAVKALFNENIYPRCPHMQRPDFIDIRPPTDDSDHNTPLGDDTNDNDEWYNDLPDLPQHQNAPHHNDDMSNPSDPDESIDNGNTMPLPATLKGKQRAVEPPTTSRPDRRNPQLEQGGRVRQPPKPHKGDIYGERNPIDRQRMGAKDWKKLIGDNPVPSDSNQSDNGQPSLEDMMAQMAQEGGVSLINFLMQKAVPLHEGNTPSPTSVREWSFHDILKLPKKEQEEWKTACQDKLEALKRQEVFEITDLPKGCKIIKNRWVFDIKTDGCKKACLVAKGFSQVERINFFELFSPVVCFETVHFMLALSSLEDWHVQGLDV